MHLDRTLDVIMLSVLSQIRADKNMLPAIKPQQPPPPNNSVPSGEFRMVKTEYLL